MDGITQQITQQIKGEIIQKIIQLLLTDVAARDGRGTQQQTGSTFKYIFERMRLVWEDGDNSKNTTINGSEVDAIFYFVVGIN